MPVGEWPVRRPRRQSGFKELVDFGLRDQSEGGVSVEQSGRERVLPDGMTVFDNRVLGRVTAKARHCVLLALGVSLRGREVDVRVGSGAAGEEVGT